MFRRGLFVLGLLALAGAFGCTTVGPSIALSGLPAIIADGGTYTLTLTGSPGTSSGLWTYTLSSSCGGTFTLVSPPGLPVAGNLVIGPTDAKTVQVKLTVTNPTADLSVTKSDTPDPVGVGYTLTYTLTVGNVGICTITAKLTTSSGRTSTTSQNTSVDAANVVVTDTLPANVTFVSATPSQGSCSGAATVTCNLGTIANGASATVEIKVTPQAGAVPSITNSASVTGAITDSTPANNTATAVTTVTPVADLSVTKDDNPDPVNATQNLTYTVTVTNNGPSAATNVTVTDTLPTAVTFVSASAGCTYNAGPHTVTCSWASIAASGSQTATIVVKPTGAALSLTNSVAVSAAEFDPNTTNNSDTETTTVNPAADLSVAKSDNPDPVKVGDELTYTITVTNNGPNNATGVTVTDTLPATVNFVSASAGCTYSAPTVTCAIGNLAASANTSVEIKVTPQAGAVPSITNSVSVTGNEFDPDASNNSDSEDTTVNPVADLSVSKGDSPDPVTYGQNVTYTVTVTNGGPSDAANVTLTDTLPSNAQLVSATPSQGSCSGTTTVTCNLGTINNGNSATVTIVVQAKSASVDLTVDDDPGNNGALVCPASVINPVSVTSDAFDPNTGNNSASVTTTVTANYAHVQDAVNVASAGQTISVCPGTYGSRFFQCPWHPNCSCSDNYSPAVIVYKDGLTIQAADPNPANTVIEATHVCWSNAIAVQNSTAGGITGIGGWAPNAVTIVANNVTIEGFTFRRPYTCSPNIYDCFWNTAGVFIGSKGAGYQDFLGNANGATVRNNVFRDVWHAVYIWHSSYNTITNNVVEALGPITNHWAAIESYDGYSDEQINYGSLSHHNTISYNTLADKGIFIGAWAPSIWTDNTGCVIRNNTATSIGRAYSSGTAYECYNSVTPWTYNADPWTSCGP